MAERDTSRDGFTNKVQTFLLTRFKPIWKLIQRIDFLNRRVNKFLVNSAIYKAPTRPHPFSLMTLDEFVPGTADQRFEIIPAYVPEKGIPKQPDPYTSWESLIDRTYTGRHLPPDPEFNRPDNLPKLEDLAVLFGRKKDAAGN